MVEGLKSAPTGAERGAFMRLILPLLLTEVAASLGLTMLFAAMRKLVVDLGSASAAGWLITSYMLSSAAGAALLGRLGDLKGRRTVLLWVLALGTLGSLIAAVTREPALLILGRVLQGMVGAAMPLCFGLMRERTHAELVPRGIGLIASTASIFAGIGLLAGGIVVDLFDWPAIFKLLTGLCLLAFLALLLLVEPDDRTAEREKAEDLLGGLLFVPAAVGLLLAVDKAGHAGFGDPQTWLFLAVALAALAAWIWRELTAHAPLIQIRLLAIPDIAFSNLLFVFTALGVFQGGQIMALFGQQPAATGVGLGLSAVGAALLLTPTNILTGMIFPRFAELNRTLGPRLIATTGALLMAAGWGALILPLHDQLWFVVVALFVQALGLGMVFVTIPLVIVAACPPERTSESTGMMVVIRSTAMAIGAQTVATMLSRPAHGAAGAANAALPSEGAYMLVFGFVTAMALIAALIATRLPRRLQIAADDRVTNAHG